MSKYETLPLKHLSSWIKNREVEGYYTFTKNDVLSLDLPLNSASISNALSRQISRGIIMSPWQNFYVIIPTEYKLRGIIPPSFYIDNLMHFLEKDYYISLLTAAELNGSSHQHAMVYYVTANGKFIRDVNTNGYRIDFTLSQTIPHHYINKLKVQTGYINVASAELTALDIIANNNKIGGVGRAAETLSELCEAMHWDNSKQELLNYFSTATVQRLGYLLDLIGESEQADNLYFIMCKSAATFRRILLKSTAPANTTTSINNRWKVIDNYPFDIDEI